MFDDFGTPQPTGEAPNTAAQPLPQGSAAHQDGEASHGPQAEADAADPLDAFTAEIWAGPATPGGYNFGLPPRGAEVSMDQELRVRQAFHEHGLPVSVGNQFGRMWHEALAKGNPPDDVTLELGKRSGYNALEKKFGAETGKVLAVANAEVERIARTLPEIKTMLKQSGLGNSPYLVETLFNLARGKGRA